MERPVSQCQDRFLAALFCRLSIACIRFDRIIKLRLCRISVQLGIKQKSIHLSCIRRLLHVSGSLLRIPQFLCQIPQRIHIPLSDPLPQDLRDRPQIESILQACQRFRISLLRRSPAPCLRLCAGHIPESFIVQLP